MLRAYINSMVRQDLASCGSCWTAIAFPVVGLFRVAVRRFAAISRAVAGDELATGEAHPMPLSSPAGHFLGVWFGSSLQLARIPNAQPVSALRTMREGAELTYENAFGRGDRRVRGRSGDRRLRTPRQGVLFW